jgi:hypothetical protein
MSHHHHHHSPSIETQIISPAPPQGPSQHTHDPPMPRVYHWHHESILILFCEARFAGMSPWFAPVHRRCHRLRGIHFELVCPALCIFAPRSTLNKLLLTVVTLFSQAFVAAWPLAVAAEQHQNAVPHCLLRSKQHSAPYPHIKL